MDVFKGAVFIILILIIVFLLFILRIFWDVFATSVTLRLLQNNTGNYSSTKILVWVFIIISIVFLIGFFSKKQTTRPSLSRSED